MDLLRGTWCFRSCSFVLLMLLIFLDLLVDLCQATSQWLSILPDVFGEWNENNNDTLAMLLSSFDKDDDEYEDVVDAEGQQLSEEEEEVLPSSSTSKTNDKMAVLRTAGWHQQQLQRGRRRRRRRKRKRNHRDWQAIGEAVRLLSSSRGGGGSSSSCWPDDDDDDTPLLDQVVSTSVHVLSVGCIWQCLGTILSANNHYFATELATRLISPESVEALKTIKSILDGVHDQHGVVDVFGKYRKRDIIVSIYALNQLQNAAKLYEHLQRDVVATEKNGAAIIAPSDVEEHKKLLKELAHYAVYAHATYGWKMDLAMRLRLHVGGDVQALLRRTGIEREDIVAAKWSSQTHRPAYFLVRDRRQKSLVLALRGTWSAIDLLTDLCCTPRDFELAESNNNHSTDTATENGTMKTKSVSFVSSLRHSAEDIYERLRKQRRCGHHGMLEAGRAVQQELEALLEKELSENPDYSLVLVGHSLGAGVAAILGTLLERKFPSLRVYGFGAPCVAPHNAKLHRNIVSVISDGDPFATLSLGHVADVSIALSSLCEDPTLRNDILLRTNSKPIGDLEYDDLQWCFETMEGLRKKMTSEKLFPPGRILLLSGASLSKRRRKDASLREVPPTYFRELIVGPRIIDLSRHIPSLYESTLKDLATLQRAELPLSVVNNSIE